MITHILSGLTVFIVGLELGMVGIGETLDVSMRGCPFFPLHVTVAMMTLFVPIGFSIWGRVALKLLCSFFGLIVGIIGAFSIGLLGPAKLATTASA